VPGGHAPPRTPDLVSRQESAIRRIAAGLLDKFAGKARIDVVDEFAYPLPVTMICSIRGCRAGMSRDFTADPTVYNGPGLGPEAGSEKQQRL
jgi:fatty acid omega-hydroxylase